MQSSERRSSIARLLAEADAPVSAGALAAKFDVSRQIIVGDIAVLRAGGTDITATPRGYIMNKAAAGIVRTIAVCHTGAQVEQELNTIVDMGCSVLDVIVEHPVYGQISGALSISSRYDVSRFVERCSGSGAHPLSGLTHGIHLHTLACPDEDAYRRVCDRLTELGILLKD